MTLGAGRRTKQTQQSNDHAWVDEFLGGERMRRSQQQQDRYDRDEEKTRDEDKIATLATMKEQANKLTNKQTNKGTYGPGS